MKPLFNEERVLGMLYYTFLLIYLKKAIHPSFPAFIRCHLYFTSKWTI